VVLVVLIVLVVVVGLRRSGVAGLGRVQVARFVGHGARAGDAGALGPAKPLVRRRVEVELRQALVGGDHHVPPDRARHTATGDRIAVEATDVDVVHREAVVLGVADPDGGRHLHRDTRVPDRDLVVGRTGLATGRPVGVRVAGDAGGRVLEQT